MKLTVISQYHPASALHQPRLWATLLDDWANLPENVPHDYAIATRASNVFSGATLCGFDTEQDGSGGLGQWSVATRAKDGGLYVLPRYGVDKGFRFGDSLVAAHNWKYDLRVLRDNKMKEPKNLFDSMIAAYCLGLGKQAPRDSSKTKSGADMVGGLGLKYLARRHLGMQMKTWHEVKDHPELVPEYNADDSVATYLLAEKWLPVLPQHYFDIDMPLLPVLMKMEDRGVAIDPKFLRTFANELDNRLADLDAEIPLNVHATQEVASYVYGNLGIEPWKFTESGAPSVDADTLSTIHDPVVNKILEYKSLYKDKGTYVNNYVKMRDPNDRVHCEFKQTSTSTGRLSCARPNLQNVDKEGDMRKLFVAPEGKKLVRLDWEQMEWIALAALTQDPILIKELQSGKKIHQVTADQMGVSYGKAKTANFAIQYGAQAWTLAQNLECTIGEAREFMKLYFKKFPGVKKYQEMMREVALKDKKVTNWFGRTKRIDAMFIQQKRIQEEGIKEAINMPIQGMCGEIVKIAMIKLDKKSAPMILQVHDELLFEVDEKEAVEYGQWLKEFVPSLTEVNGLRFPIDIKIGKTWHDCL